MCNWKKKALVLALAGLALFSAAGCGGSADKKGAGKGGEIVLYTSQPEADAQKLIATFNQDHPDIKVKVFRSGTEEVVSKVLAEQTAGTVQADVLLVADNVTFEQLKQKDMLEKYASPELKGIPEAYIDKDHTYTGTKVITTGIIVNTSKAKGDPKTFADLAKPEFAASAIMPSPLYSGAAAYNLGVITRTQGMGWPYYEALKKNGMTVTKGNGAVQKAVVAGEKAYGMIADYMANNSRKKGAPVKFIYPAEGSPAVTEPIGLLKTSKNKEAAKTFIDFVLSKKGQETAAKMGYTPVKEGVQPPEGLKAITDFKALTVSVADLFQNRAADKERFTTLFQK